jgi:hypothetical protein
VARPALIPFSCIIAHLSDTCPRESVLLWAKELRTWHPTLLFRSASSLLSAVAEPLVKGKEKANDLDKDALGVDSILECLGQWAQEKGGEQPLTVVVVGLTNASLPFLSTSIFGLYSFRLVKVRSSTPSFENPYSLHTNSPHRQWGPLQLHFRRRLRLMSQGSEFVSSIRPVYRGIRPNPQTNVPETSTKYVLGISC